MRFICRDSPYVVHFKFRDSYYIVHVKCRDCPYVVHLNVGTVPPFSPYELLYLNALHYLSFRQIDKTKTALT